MSPKINVINLICMIISIASIAGCSTTIMHIYQATDGKTICGDKNNSLGYIAVLPETAWRKNQKEPDKRKSMALEVIENSFQGVPCGKVSSPGGIRGFSNWSNRPESELLKQFSDEGVDTIILLRIEELTPQLHITFSLPFLWAGSNEADFRVRVLSVDSGDVLTDMRVRRSTGGPFNIRPAEWSKDELKAALDEIMH